MNSAIGLMEVQSFTAALLASDAAAKTAAIEILAMEATRPAAEDDPIPLTIIVKLRGDVSSVKEALEAGARAASKICDQVKTHVIARGSIELEREIHYGNVGYSKPISS